MGITAAHCQFGPFHLDAAEHRLLRNGVEVPLQLKVFETLCLLVENAGRLIKKEDLLSQVWPDTAVEENNLNKNISILRKALGDHATGQSYIETVPRVGYRFVAEEPAWQMLLEELSTFLGWHKFVEASC